VTASTTSDLSPAGPRRQQRGIQLPQLLLSLLVVAVFALLAVWWQASTNSRMPVVALAADVAQGEPITAEQLTQIYISSDIAPRVQPATDIGVFVGARPIADFSAGTLITTEMFVAGAELRSGEAFVGLVLDNTRAPSSLVAGDRVQVLLPARGQEQADIVADGARVESVRLEGSLRVVRLRMDLNEAQRVQINSGTVSLIEIDNSGLAWWEKADAEDDGS